jgi:hypothetical protein
MTVELVPFDPAEFLEIEADIADYLTDMLAEGGAALTQHAIGVAARARAKIAAPGANSDNANSNAEGSALDRRSFHPSEPFDEDMQELIDARDELAARIGRLERKA